MFYNRLQLVTELGNRLKSSTAGTSITSQRLAYWLGEAQDEIAQDLQPKHLIKTVTFNTAASQQKYFLPFAFNSILSVIDTAQDLELTEKSEADIEALDPKFNDGGAPFFFWLSSFYNVRAQPSAASVVRVVSTSAGDTGTLLVTGINNATSEEEYEAITVNGTTPVNGTTSWSEIFSVAYSTSYNRTSTLTVTTNAQAVTVAIIKPGMQADGNQPLFLWPTPSGANAMRVRGIKRPRVMATDNHFPDFPEEYHEGVLLCALKRAHRDLLRYGLADQVEQKEYLPFLARIRRKTQNRLSKHSPVINGRQPSIRGGRLPSNYPQY
jgi:hypothetical protein